MTEKNMWCLNFWISVNSLTTLSFVFLTLTILTGVKRNLKVILVYISLIQRMFNTFLGILFAICVFFFENYLFSLLAHLVIWVEKIWVVMFSSSTSFKFQTIFFYQMHRWQNFLPFCGIIYFVKSCLSLITLSSCVSIVLFRKFLPMPMCSSMVPTFSSMSFRIPSLMLKFLINLKFCAG